MFYRILFTGFGLLFFSLTLKAQIVNIEDRRKTLDTVGWFGQLDLGGRYTRNSDEFLTLNGGLRLDRFQQKSHLLFLADYRVARSGSNNFLNAGFGHIRYSRIINERLSWEVFTQVQYDEKLKLNVRFLAGTGPRFDLVSGERGDISLGVLYMYEYDELEQVSLVFRDHRISSYLSLRYKVGGFTSVSNTTYYQPRLWNFDRTRISSVTSVVFKISDKISFTTRFNLTQDARINEVFPDIPKVTFTWLNGLRLGF